MLTPPIPRPRRTLFTFAFFVLCACSITPTITAASNVEPIRALLITGGGWHDYEGQKTILTEGISARANVDWKIVAEGMTGSTDERSRQKVSLQQKSGWGDDFDLVVYNMCFSGVTDVDFIEGIAKVHEEGLPALVIHCAMHSYRDAETKAWRKLLGVESNRHEAHRPFTVENLAPEHPIMRNFPSSWKTPQGELYMIEQVDDSVTPLARAYGVDTKKHHLTVWTNEYGKGRIFGTTIGHHNETMATDEYLNIVANGVLWAAGKLNEDGSPADGYGPSASSSKRLVLVAGRPSHGRGSHEHNAGVRIFERCLADVPGLEVIAHYNGWPEEPGAFDGADGILLYLDGGKNHPILRGDRLQEMQDLMDKGVGLAAFHWATEVTEESGRPQYLDWLGGFYEAHFSVNPIWEPEFKDLPDHPITRGVEPFSVRDEWYFNFRFRDGIVPILQAAPSDETRDGPYVSPKGPYPHIVEEKGRIETVAWAVERDDGGRGFGFTGGHFHANWGNENFRKIALNALVWIAGAEVPPEGVVCAVTKEDLEKNLD